MREMLKVSLDESTIGEILSEMEYYNYSEELQELSCFPQYEELFIDIARAATELSGRFYSICGQFSHLPDIQNSGFDLAAMMLNYTRLDYFRAADTCSGEDATQYESDITDALSTLSKQDQRCLIVSVFEVMADFQQLKATFKTLVDLLYEFDHYNNEDMEVFFQSGGDV